MAELAKGAKAAVNEAAGIGKDGAAAGDLKELKRCKEEALRLQAALTDERRKGLEQAESDMAALKALWQAHKAKLQEASDKLKASGDGAAAAISDTARAAGVKAAAEFEHDADLAAKHATAQLGMLMKIIQGI